jgi:hypothetical protein
MLAAMPGMHRLAITARLGHRPFPIVSAQQAIGWNCRIPCRLASVVYSTEDIDLAGLSPEPVGNITTRFVVFSTATATELRLDDHFPVQNM